MEKWKTRIRCKEINNTTICNALLEIEENDIRLYYSNSISYCVLCPCCSNLTIINEITIPLKIQKKVLLLKKQELVKEVI